MASTRLNGPREKPLSFLPRSRWKRGAIFFFLIFFPLAAAWWLFTPKPPLLDGVSFSTAVYDRNGRLMRLGLSQDDKYRIFTPLAQIAPHLREATMIYEDRHFYRHPGVNPLALLRAASGTYFGGKRRMGASTITMQLARMRLGLDSSDIWGKIRQIERALAYERHYGKDELFEAYLNLAPYGGNIEGVGAAAEIYFHKNPKALDLVESLSLVSVPQNPTRRNPLAARRMDEQGRSDADLDEARQRIYRLWLEEHPKDLGAAFLQRGRLIVHPQSDLPFAAPHLTTEALALYPHNHAVHASIDSRLQNLSESMLQGMVRRSRGMGVENGALLLLHWPSMEVRAMAGSVDFFNTDIQGQVDGTRAKRSPGSTLKPFIYALAMDQGIIHQHSLLFDSPRSFGGYDPENADQRFQGPISAAQALRLSRNIPAITLANQLNSPDLYDFLRGCGVNFPQGRDHYGLSLVLGGAETSMRELAALYAMLPNKGQYREAIFFKKVQKAAPARQAQEDGQANEADVSRKLSPEAALLTLDMLRTSSSDWRLRQASVLSRIPLYYKTGTSNGTRDAWTAGVFGPYVLVVWAGNFDNTGNPHFVGASLAAPLFRDLADAIYAMEQMRDLPLAPLYGGLPDNFSGRHPELNLTRIKVCSQTGDLNTKLCQDTRNTWFIPGVSPIADSGVFREILIDRETGLRACVEDPDRTEKKVWEFWPTELLRIFRLAGIQKPPPPPFLPECAEGNFPIPGTAMGLAPEILSPKAGLRYYRSVNHPEGSVVTLNASGDADVTGFYWFRSGPVGPEQFIGRSLPGQTLVWTPPGGPSRIRVLDNFGRSSSVRINVELSE